MGKKILVVDDSATVRQQVRMALSQAGFDIVEAVDGIDGVEKIREAGDVALVICDVNMPRRDGIEMVEELQKDAQHGGTPVIMLTTEGDPDLIARAKAAGAKGWIVKPFNADLLVSAANKLAG